MTLEQDKGEKPFKMTEENQGEFCFNGDKNDEWLKTVQDLNYLHDMIYPTVLEKDTKGGWKRVHPDFPDIAGILPNEMDPGYKAMEFVQKHVDMINPEKANREEKKGFTCII